VVKQTVDGKLIFDAHYVKGEPHFPARLPRGRQWNMLTDGFCFLAIRAIKKASKFGHKEQGWYLKVATRFTAEFDYYGGFGEIDGTVVDQLMALMPQLAPEKEA
jgi:hypothetical protein